MTTAGRADETDDRELDTIAWQFLCSQYTERIYWDWPLERRLDAYLRHRNRQDILNDGAAYATVLDQVMANMGRARRDGVLAPPNV
ncbi:hypothetical protein ACXDF8_15350 [Mycolicibacterium sp. CBM1]